MLSAKHLGTNTNSYIKKASHKGGEILVFKKNKTDKKKPQGSIIHVVIGDYEIDWLMNVSQEINLHPQVKVVGFAQNGKMLIDLAKEMKADAIIVDSAMPDITIRQIALELEEELPTVPIFAISHSNEDGYIRELRALGATEVFPRKNFNPQKVAEFLATFVDAVRNEQDWFSNSERENEMQELSSKPYSKKSGFAGQIVLSTYNPKGGVGKTTIATNLAVAIKASPFIGGEKVCLVDFDLSGGNVATVLHMSDGDTAKHNISMLENIPLDIEVDELEPYLLDGPYGLKVVASPGNYVATQDFDASIADNVLAVLKKIYKVIIIDGAPSFSPLSDIALAHSTHVFLVANPEGQSIKQLSRLINMLEINKEQGKPNPMKHIARKMFLIVNHIRPKIKSNIPNITISKMIGKPVFAEIPFHNSVIESLHASETTLPIDNESTLFTKNIKMIANSICNAYPGAVEDFDAQEEDKFHKEKNQEKKKTTKNADLKTENKKKISLKNLMKKK